MQVIYKHYLYWGHEHSVIIAYKTVTVFNMKRLADSSHREMSSVIVSCSQLYEVTEKFYLIILVTPGTQNTIFKQYANFIFLLDR